jgi:hypothetical protein
MTTTPSPAPSDRPTFQLVLRASNQRGDPDGSKRLKRLLKSLLRSYGFACQSIRRADR